MNNVCLCIGNYARNPFYIKFSDISLYSIEELCYYFMERVHLLDDSIVSAELVNWIRHECGLPELADELDVYVRKRMSVASFVSTIFERTGMYDSSTVKQVDRILKEQSNLTTIEKYKKRAEYLYQQGRFRQALAIYSELVAYIPSGDSAGKHFYVTIWRRSMRWILHINRRQICIMKRICCILTDRQGALIFWQTRKRSQITHTVHSSGRIRTGRRIFCRWSRCVCRQMRNGLLPGRESW